MLTTLTLMATLTAAPNPNLLPLYTTPREDQLIRERLTLMDAPSARWMHGAVAGGILATSGLGLLAASTASLAFANYDSAGMAGAVGALMALVGAVYGGAAIIAGPILMGLSIRKLERRNATIDRADEIDRELAKEEARRESH